MYVDVSSPTNYESAFLRCLEAFGGRLDVVVNNAGMNGDANWESMLNVNLKGCITGCKLAVRYMGMNGRAGVSTMAGGVVVNVSSVQGLVSFPIMPAYAAGKSAIVQYTRCIQH